MYSAIARTLALAALALLLPGRPADAHCDTMNGPVVAAARLALQRGDVTPVLKWIKPEAEPEIRAAFDKTLAVRALGPSARDLADRFFFETLVRVPRAGEGAPYEGLKAEGATVDPAVEQADKALDDGGSIDAVVNLVAGEMAAGIRARWEEVAEAKRHADDSVAAGRRYVEAYVEYVHYVENLHVAAGGGRAAHSDGERGTDARHRR